MIKGTQNWLQIVKTQIKEQEKRGLMMFSRDIDALMKLRHGVGMSSLLKDIDVKNEIAAKRDKILDGKLKRKLASISQV